jgi:hypothetical protein
VDVQVLEAVGFSEERHIGLKGGKNGLERRGEGGEQRA